MSKYKAPPPTFRDVYVALEGYPLRYTQWVAFQRPGATRDQLYCGVELVYTHKDGRYSVVRREGEGVSTRGADSPAGACYRAALRLFLYMEGKDEGEVVKAHLWNIDAHS